MWFLIYFRSTVPTPLAQPVGQQQLDAAPPSGGAAPADHLQVHGAALTDHMCGQHDGAG
ncbi:hypothetical protein AVEN_10391-1, partial [Araneus ventricosus]